MVRKEILLTAGFSVLAAAVVAGAVFLTEPGKVLYEAPESAVSATRQTNASTPDYAPTVAVSISLRPVTAAEFAGIGTHGIKNPIPTDFQTLTIDVKGENLGKRIIQVPATSELTDALTDQVVWCTHSGRQDNVNENYVNYHEMLVLFTRNISKQVLDRKLGALFVGVSYEDANGKQVNRTYALSEPVPSVKPEEPVSSWLQKYQRDGRNYYLEAGPQNEAEEAVAVNFLCPFDGDFKKMAEVEGSDPDSALNISSIREAVAAGRYVKNKVVHSLSSQPKGTAPAKGTEWAFDSAQKHGLVSWRIVTASYTEEWPAGIISPYGNGVFCRDFLVGRTKQDTRDRIYDYALPVVIQAYKTPA